MEARFHLDPHQVGVHNIVSKISQIPDEGRSEGARRGALGGNCAKDSRPFR